MFKKSKKTAIVAFVFLVFIILATCITGCVKTEQNNDKINIVTTIFPEYDWVKNIIGNNNDNIELTMLIDNGVDLHSYQPSADDIVKIISCDMFIYVGGESDKWVDDVVSKSTNKDIIVIDLIDVLGNKAKQEEIKEGMQTEEDCDDEEGQEYDEHIWLSLKNASTLCSYICEKICLIDEKNKGTYIANSESYIKKIEELDKQYEQAVESSSLKTLLFADRFPFRYLVNDYGLDYYAAFLGCSAESEVNPSTFAFLANKIDELNLKVILKCENSDGSIAKTVKETTKTKNQKILTMDSMQSITEKDVKNGITYLSVMAKNLDTLKDALK